MCHRIQAALGNYMAWLLPRAQLVPVVDPDNLHPDKAVVRGAKGGGCSWILSTIITETLI